MTDTDPDSAVLQRLDRITALLAAILVVLIVHVFGPSLFELAAFGFGAFLFGLAVVILFGRGLR